MDETRSENRSKADLNLGIPLLVFASIAIAVLVQSDAALILPHAAFDPSGSFGGSAVPLLQFNLLYSAGPIGLLGLHAVVLLRRDLLKAATPLLRIAALWLPFGVLALIRWRFAPYVSAPPTPTFAGSLLETVQILVLTVDLVFIVLALLPAPRHSPHRAARAIRLLGVASVAATIWLIVLLAWDPARSLVAAAEPDAAGLAFLEGAELVIALVLVANLFVGARSKRLPSFSRLFKDNLTMRDRLVLLIAFLVGALAPAYGRTIDLSGERLVAGKPGEAAGGEVGHGVDLSSWSLQRASFDHATMAGIRLVGTDLRGASLDHADLAGADLTQSKLARASLRYADLSNAVLAEAHFAGGSLQGAAMSGVSMQGAVLSSVEGRRGDIVLAQQDQPSGTPPSRADAKDRLDMTGVDLSGAHLDGANLSNAILKDAIFKGADLKDALFCGADLRNVDLTGALNIGTAVFNGADLAGATLPKDMPSGHLRNANLFRIRIEAAPSHDWGGLIGSDIRNVDSLTGPPSHDASVSVHIRTVTDIDDNKLPEPCSEPVPAKP